MLNYSKHILSVSIVVVITGSLSSCKKLVSIDEPISTVTSQKIFNTELQAEGALAGVYNSLIHGPANRPGFNPARAIYNAFGGGLTTLAAGLSGGEFTNYSGSNDIELYALETNRLSILMNQYPTTIWKSAYNVIYNANSVIEGIAASNSGQLRDSVRKQLTAEAKFLRAFCYFYLTNLFGDVPLALTVDFNKTAYVAKSLQQDVYVQIRKDLLDAQKDLAPDYSVSGGKRVRANKWAATALLAKVYLFMKEYDNAAASASEVINQTSLFGMEQNLNTVFLTGSREAIFQLMQTNQDPALKGATAEGIYMLTDHQRPSNVVLTNELLTAFEPGDRRRKDWTDSTYNIYNGVSTGITWYPSKYKDAGTLNAPQKEFYMVLRLAEMYLIRAEARINGASGGLSEGIKDLNVIRKRAMVDELLTTLGLAAAKSAVAKERQIELFSEWGNRWLDLKRTGMAGATLSAMAYKQPWAGDHQLLYPIPPTEVQLNTNLIQNSGY